MTLIRLTDHESMTPDEELGRGRKSAPGPFQDAVAGMFIRGVTAPTTARFFNIGLREVNAIVRWVCETNMRRPPIPPTRPPHA